MMAKTNEVAKTAILKKGKDVEETIERAQHQLWHETMETVEPSCALPGAIDLSME